MSNTERTRVCAFKLDGEVFLVESVRFDVRLFKFPFPAGVAHVGKQARELSQEETNKLLARAIAVGLPIINEQEQDNDR